MKDCPALHGKSWYNKAKETGLQNAGEARLASYSGNFGTLIFYISEIRAGQDCENERREVKEGMGRKRNPERDQSLKRYIESGGKMTLEELAAAAGVPKARISKWKSEDKWEDKLKEAPKRKGGQRGNKNAAGRTPKKDGNKNAVTHGAFAKAGIEDIDPEKAEEIKAVKPGGSIEKMTEELQSLLARKAYLEGLLQQYTAPEAEGAFYADKLVHMAVPKTLEEVQGEQDSGIDTGQVKDPEGGTEKLKTAMKTIIKSSAFDRAMKVEAELNRLHGRIIKQIDSIKSYEMEERRLSLEERKYQLAKQKLTGEIIVDDETEEIIDDLIDDG